MEYAERMEWDIVQSFSPKTELSFGDGYVGFEDNGKLYFDEEFP
jgi:hypothetical protein